MEEEIDLLENYELLPDNVQKILLSFDDEKGLYKECSRVIEELEKVGYTAKYDLSGTLYDLKKL